MSTSGVRYQHGARPQWLKRRGRAGRRPMKNLYGQIDHHGDIRWQVLPWRGANRRCHHLRIGHDSGHLFNGHVHGSLLPGPHLLGASLFGSHLLGAHLRDLDDGQRDDLLGDYQREFLHRALHKDARDDGSGDVHDQI
jgi:hypothetical protein